jgi:hypothetical protein
MKLKQMNLDQTGVAIFKTKDEEKQIPLYSLKPFEEAQEIKKNYYNNEGITLEAIYITNNLMTTKIEDLIESYMNEYSALPENYMEELISGFPYIIGKNISYSGMFYA